MHLFGLKTESWFDVWSIEHFISGILLTSLLCFIWPKIKQPPVSDNKVPIYIALLTLAFLWECVEFYLEAGYSGNPRITYWFQGVEFWGNRLITDPLMMIAGAYTYLSVKRILLPARLFSMAWLTLHIFVFQHSMYLHTAF